MIGHDSSYQFVCCMFHSYFQASKVLLVRGVQIQQTVASQSAKVKHTFIKVKIIMCTSLTLYYLQLNTKTYFS